MDTSGKKRRTRTRIRGKSNFAAFDEIALYSDALTGGELSSDSSRQGAERVLLLKVLSAWSCAVGVHLKTVARPAVCRQGRLTVDVRDGGWKRELERARHEILARMNRLLPEHPIHEISFRLRSASAADTFAPATRARALARLPLDRSHPTAERAPVESALPLESLVGDELGDRLRQVMGRYLARSH